MGGLRKASKARAILVASLAGVIALFGAIAASRAQDPATPPAPEDAILERQLAMQSIEEHSDTLGGILAGIEPIESLGPVTRQIANDALAIRTSFQTQAPGGSSKPEVWSNWDDFSRRLDEMVTNTEAMAVMGEAGNLSAVNEAVVDALPCRQCHEVYRAPRTPRAAPAPTP